MFRNKCFSMFHVTAAFVLATGMAAAQSPPLKGGKSTAPLPPKLKGPATNPMGGEKLPDLIVSEFSQSGAPVYEGTGIRVPVKIRFTNQGTADADFCGLAVRCVSGDFEQTPSEAKFTKPGSFYKNDMFTQTVPALAAGKSVTMLGQIGIHDPNKKLSGQKVYVRIFVDAQTGDTPVPYYVRIKESVENNNWSKAISFTGPK